ncbi:MAG: hypothetical protein Pg6C_03470 [Treponemataceae bacterium]|nr:MAG: hypothetical protein Pg6C_03470 [Treponemataceae bacterium]
MAESNKPQAVYEPGELARTREKLGVLDAEEAKIIAQKLGGVVGVEKAAPINVEAIKKVRKLQERGNSEGRREPSKPRQPSKITGSAVQTPSAPVSKRAALPALAPKERAKMELVMMSNEFQIKQSYGIFNFFYFLMKNRPNTVLNSYVKRTIHRHITRIQAFNETIFEILQLAPESHRQKVMNPEELRHKLMKKFAGWPKLLDDIKKLSTDVDVSSDQATVEMLVPIIRAFYKMFAQVLYLGETRVTAIFKAEFDELSSYPDAKKKELIQYMKTVISEWQYIYDKAIIGMYPLLMRMVSTECYESANDFFMSDAARILPFLGITKYDVLVADKKQSADNLSEEVKVEKAKLEEAEKAEKAEKAKQEEEKQRERFKLVQTGFKLLEVMFPGAGWRGISLSIDSVAVDMFPYFQPIYQFPDGMNLLAPENPVQIIIVLIRILEDFFRGCRNIEFNLPAEIAQTKNDSFAVAIAEWMSYREVLFEKNYATDLKDYVNNAYSKSEFSHSAIGKKLMYNLLWQTKQYFLPFFKIDSLPMEKPSRDVTLKSLCARIDFLRDIFAVLAEKIDAASRTRDAIPEIPNAWEKYKFDIDNAVSMRLDVLLGAKKNSPMAVNASIVKYTAAVIAVLNWWINDESSPARNQDDFKLYRTSSDDGKPVFSVDLRNDTEDLFKRNLKKLAQGSQTAKKTERGAEAAQSAAQPPKPVTADKNTAPAPQNPVAPVVAAEIPRDSDNARPAESASGETAHDTPLPVAGETARDIARPEDADNTANPAV